MRISSCLKGLAVTALALTLATVCMAQPAKVGELEPASIATPHPYAKAWGTEAREWAVSYPGATYIRVHFSGFNLAPGDWVEITDPAGNETFTFSGKGPFDSGEFWASTIVGDTAIIRLQAKNGGGYGFEIDSFGRGTQDWFEPNVPSDPPSGDSVCGANDWEDVKCYENSHPDQYEHARAAAKLQIGCCSACTGWKASDSGQFFTNNHCFSTSGSAQATEVQLAYQNAACGGGGSSIADRVNGLTVLATDYTLDYTLFTTTGDSSAYPCLQLANRQAKNGDQIYIAHHPSAGVKKMSIFSDRNAGGVCRVDDQAHTGRAVGSDIGYYCDTTNGSSGSPVLDYNTHEVIALHHFGGCLNSGGRSDLVHDDLASKGVTIDSCSGGGGATCGDGACNGGETECSCPQDCGTPPSFEQSCTDGLDDDCDGFTDCDDSDCSTDPACQAPTCGAKSDPCSSDSECCSGKCKGKKGSQTCR